jgi:hypothetical protein
MLDRPEKATNSRMLESVARRIYRFIRAVDQQQA